MVTYIIAGYTFLNFLKKSNFSSSILHGIASGATMAIRIPGIFIFAVSILHFIIKLIQRKKTKRDVSVILMYIFSFFISLYILYPILWDNPFERLKESFGFMANHPQDVDSLFMGELILTQENPWYYLPIWFGVTTPIVLLLIYFKHLTEVVKFIPKYLLSKLSLHEERVFLTSILFFGPWLVVIILGATIYNGWRHMFFTYPFFVVVVVWTI